MAYLLVWGADLLIRLSILFSEQLMVSNSSTWQLESLEISFTIFLIFCRYFLTSETSWLFILYFQIIITVEMKKRRDSDAFSFTGEQPSSERYNDRKQLMANYQYRIDALERNELVREGIAPKVLELDRVIEENAKRKYELEQKLGMKKEDFVEPGHLKDLIEKNFMYLEAKEFSGLQKQKRGVDKQNLTGIMKGKATKPYEPSKIELDQVELALMEKQLSFPQYPCISKQKQQQLRSRLETLSKVHEHSDVVYLLMVCLYHLSQYYEVLNRVRELIMFKRFNPKGLWVAAEAAYNLEVFDQCKKLSELSISHIKDNAKILPRVLYLKAKSNLQLHNHLDAIVCYNQLITLQPSVPEYYLERSLLFERANYNQYAKADFDRYRKLKPGWEKTMKQRVLGEKSVDHKQYYQSLLASLQEQ